ncbi:helix-turn-helix transcriptional regulator [Nubsella zeaxanthinifaciens]|uniref:helix-turn-helix transcriptional regulator n=1 Tax=Nubsella zeaxanthinifaciens TaxID=392412 RepID=UPI003CFE0C1D
MAVANFKQKFEALVSKETASWHQDADFRQENRSWLKKSQAIAIKINKALTDKSMSQKELAEKMGVSPQQVNKIVKGRENLTLETIGKLEMALGISLIEVAKHSIYTSYNTQASGSALTKTTKEAYHNRQPFNNLKASYMRASENAIVIKLSA